MTASRRLGISVNSLRKYLLSSCEEIEVLLVALYFFGDVGVFLFGDEAVVFVLIEGPLCRGMNDEGENLFGLGVPGVLAFEPGDAFGVGLAGIVGNPAITMGDDGDE
jgi:hypothetical protein